MIKKLLSLTLFFILVQISVGQTENENKDFSIKSKIIEVENSNVRNIELTWDFSKFTNRTNKIILNLEIEIQPINDCWNGLDGMNRSEMITKSVKDISQNPKGKFLLSLKEYNSKCFKWRAKTTNTNNGNVNYTDWQFSSFL